MSSWNDDIINRVRMEAQRAAGRRAFPRVGIVSGYDNNNGVHNVKVTFPEDADDAGTAVESGWIPHAPLWAGQGWGLYGAPAQGTQVVVQYLNGDPNCGYVSHHLPNREDPAPQVPTEEFWLIHKSGSSIKIVTGGAIHLRDNAGDEVTLDNSGNLAVSVVTDVNVTCSNANITATAVATTTAPSIQLKGDVVITGKLDVNNGPIKQNGVTVIVP